MCACMMRVYTYSIHVQQVYNECLSVYKCLSASSFFIYFTPQSISDGGRGCVRLPLQVEEYWIKYDVDKTLLHFFDMKDTKIHL